MAGRYGENRILVNVISCDDKGSKWGTTLIQGNGKSPVTWPNINETMKTSDQVIDFRACDRMVEEKIKIFYRC